MRERAQLCLDAELELDPLITHRLSLVDINTGFDAMRAGKVVRAVIGLEEPLDSKA